MKEFPIAFYNHASIPVSFSIEKMESAFGFDSEALV